MGAIEVLTQARLTLQTSGRRPSTHPVDRHLDCAATAATSATALVRPVAAKSGVALPTATSAPSPLVTDREVAFVAATATPTATRLTRAVAEVAAVAAPAPRQTATGASRSRDGLPTAGTATNPGSAPSRYLRTVTNGHQT
jgi:hypothetical protein